MLLSIIRYLKGYVKIRVVGYSPERFLNACSHRGIYLWDLKSGHGSYEMCISIQGFRKLKPIIKKTGTKVVISGRFGLPFFLHRYRKRKLFFIGAGMCVLLIYILSLFIWDIDISGNQSRTDETLIEFLETKEITHGMKKSDVNCARIVKDIRKEYDDIIWVSASIQGTRLMIQIKENEDSLPPEGEEAPQQEPRPEEQEEVHDIVADRDCVITEIVTRNGVPMVEKGAEVKKGDILVSGRVEVKNDAQEVAGYQYQDADADIRGQVSENYEDRQPLTYEVKEEQEIHKEELFVKIGDMRFGLGSLKNDYESANRFSTEHQLRIGEHFVLPVSYGKVTVSPYTVTKAPYTEKELQKILTGRFEKYCGELKKKGVEIIENNVKIYKERDTAKSRGTLTLITDIGDKVPTEILENPAVETEDTEKEQANGND